MREPPHELASGATGATIPFHRLLDEAMVWTRRSFRRLYLPVAIPLAAFSAVMALVKMLWTPELLVPSASPPSVGLILSGFAPHLFFLAVTGLVYVALTAAATARLAGREESPKQWLRFVLEPGVLGTLFLYALAIAVSLACCYVPILYVTPILCLTVPAMVVEGHRGSRALGRSARLIRHNPQKRFIRNPLTKAFALLLVVTLIHYAVSMLTDGPILLAQQWLVFRQIGSEATATPYLPSWVLWLQLPGASLSTLAGLAVWLYASFAVGLLFFDVRERKEATGLEEAILGLDEAGGESAAEEGGSPP